MRKTLNTMHAFVALPVMLAVLLVALCMPVTCAAATAPEPSRVPMPAVPQSGPLHSAMVPDAHATHHPSPSSAPAEKPAPQPDGGDDCRHTTPTIVQASQSDQQVKALDIAAAAIVPVPAPAVTLAVLVDERTGDPPGVTLTASHLRI